MSARFWNDVDVVVGIPEFAGDEEIGAFYGAGFECLIERFSDFFFVAVYVR